MKQRVDQLKIKNQAATKIQRYFRKHLNEKALKAVKGGALSKTSQSGIESHAKS